MVGQPVGGRTIERVADEPSQDRSAELCRDFLDLVQCGTRDRRSHRQRRLFEIIPIPRYGVRSRGQIHAHDAVRSYNRESLEQTHSVERLEKLTVSGWSVDASGIRRMVEEAVRRGRLDESGTCDAADLLRRLRRYRGASVMRCGRRLCCSAIPNALTSTCRSVGSVSPAFGYRSN